MTYPVLLVVNPIEPHGAAWMAATIGNVKESPKNMSPMMDGVLVTIRAQAGVVGVKYSRRALNFRLLWLASPRAPRKLEEA
jgi:hypothetical protein